MTQTLRVAYFGAAPDTPNLGVSAMCRAVIQGLARRVDDLDLTVFDFGRGVRSAWWKDGGKVLEYKQCGAAYTRRVYCPEAFANIRLCAHFGGLWNPAARLLLKANVVLDISGGDSFTDLYGQRRLKSVMCSKRLALEQGKALILLPQTYGPFHDRKARAAAADVVLRSGMAWARDNRSFQELRHLVGHDFDSDRHRLGVDVAFSLKPLRPSRALPSVVDDWLQRRDSAVVGFNVSGLVWNNPEGSVSRFGFKADYRVAVLEIISQLLCRWDCRIVLIPHVLSAYGHYESDTQACQEVLERLSPLAHDRLCALPPDYGAQEIKWIIGQLDWFCGTRMHATIAALSSGVPCAAIAYSSKALGVFESCNQGENVADPRALDTHELTEKVLNAWQTQDRARRSLMKKLPDVLRQAELQMDEIVSISL